jgi:type IV secretory pathway VirB2 component (pilin)
MLKISTKKFITFSLLAVFFLVLFSNGALAQSYDDNDMVKVLCNALNLITGGIGKTVAAFSIIALGIGFFGGKVSYAAMISVTIGIAALFGAPTIVNLVAGGNFKCEDITN